MADHAATLAQASTIEQLGPDIRTIAGGATKRVYLRATLADRIATLLRQGKSVLLKGDPGAGKTALVHSLPHASWPTTEAGQLRLVDSRASAAPRIVETHASRFIEGCRYCHDLENKMARQLDAARAKPAILFIENIDECIGMGSSSSDPKTDVANLLCPQMDKGLQVIGTTTPGGEGRMRAQNERLLGRFVVVEVPPPDEAESAEIARLHLKALRKKGVAIGDSGAEGGDAAAAAEDATVAAGLAIAKRYLPAAAPLAGFIRLADRAAGLSSHVNEYTLRRAVAEETGLLPVFVGAGEPMSHWMLCEHLSIEVLGQDEAVAEVADAIARFQAGLNESGRPAARLLLAGPSGVGKTSLGLATARLLTGDESRCIRFDMSEFADIWASERLIADEPASLVGRLCANPAGVLLLDEIEKAHPMVIRLLLQALGEARLTSEKGRTVRLDNHFVMLTTNVGSSRWLRSEPVERTTALVLCDCAEEFPPEFLGRMTRTIVFRPIDRETSGRIVVRELERVNDLPGLEERGLQLVWTSELVDALQQRGVSVEKGARGLQNRVRATVVSPLARWLAENPRARNGLVSVLPRFEGGDVTSLVVDWVDESGFFAGFRH